MSRSDAVEAGQAVYSPFTLNLYDWFVLGLSNHLIWKCPTAEMLDLYHRNVTAQHIDIGVGTGYYLDKCRWPVPSPAITLLDLNADSLQAAARRIRRYQPETIRANALEPLPLKKSYSSAGLCYLLHCLPGTIPEKAVIFDHLRPHLQPGARIFGASIMQGDVPRSQTAQALMNFYNGKGIFSNAGDTVADLDTELRKRFAEVKIERRGVVALFEATAL